MITKEYQKIVANKQTWTTNDQVSKSDMRKIFMPSVDDEHTVVNSRRRKMYSSSSFFDDPDNKYPTVEEQVDLCKSIAASLSADKNRQSRGWDMFVSRVNKASGWVFEGPDPEPPQGGQYRDQRPKCELQDVFNKRIHRNQGVGLHLTGQGVGFPSQRNPTNQQPPTKNLHTVKITQSQVISHQQISTTKTSQPPISATKTSQPPISATKTSQQPISAAKTSHQQISATKTSQQPISATKTSTQPINTTTMSHQPISATMKTSQQSINNSETKQTSSALINNDSVGWESSFTTNVVRTQEGQRITGPANSPQGPESFWLLPSAIPPQRSKSATHLPTAFTHEPTRSSIQQKKLYFESMAVSTTSQPQNLDSSNQHDQPIVSSVQKNQRFFEGVDRRKSLCELRPPFSQSQLGSEPHLHFNQSQLKSPTNSKEKKADSAPSADAQFQTEDQSWFEDRPSEISSVCTIAFIGSTSSQQNFSKQLQPQNNECIRAQTTSTPYLNHGWSQQQNMGTPSHDQEWRPVLQITDKPSQKKEWFQPQNTKMESENDQKTSPKAELQNTSTYNQNNSWSQRPTGLTIEPFQTLSLLQSPLSPFKLNSQPFGPTQNPPSPRSLMFQPYNPPSPIKPCLQAFSLPQNPLSPLNSFQPFSLPQTPLTSPPPLQPPTQSLPQTPSIFHPPASSAPTYRKFAQGVFLDSNMPRKFPVGPFTSNFNNVPKAWTSPYASTLSLCDF